MGSLNNKMDKNAEQVVNKIINDYKQIKKDSPHKTEADICSTLFLEAYNPPKNMQLLAEVCSKSLHGLCYFTALLKIKTDMTSQLLQQLIYVDNHLAQYGHHIDIFPTKERIVKALELDISNWENVNI